MVSVSLEESAFKNLKRKEKKKKKEKRKRDSWWEQKNGVKARH